MKKLLSIIMMASMIVTLTPIAGGGALTQGVAYAESSTVNVGNLDYTLNSTNSTATVVGLNNSKSSETNITVTIPADISYNGKKYNVTAIGDYAFYADTTTDTHYKAMNEKITSVTFAEGSNLTTIGYRAFSGCSTLATLGTIPASVTSIEDAAFSYCNKIASVIFAANSKLETIGASAFFQLTSITAINIPNTVTSIGGSAFGRCSKITGITIPGNVKKIGNYPFIGCTALTSVIVEEGVESIGDCVFASCGALTSITLPASVSSINKMAFYDCNSLTTIAITGNNPKLSYKDGVFYNGDGTTLILALKDKIEKDSNGTFTVPDGVKSIAKEAFYNCEIKKLVIPSSVEQIDESAFSEIASLAAFEVDSENQNFSSVDGVLYDKNQTTLICYPRNKAGVSYVIPEGVTTIRSKAFSGGNFNSLIIPASLESIGDALSVFSNSKLEHEMKQTQICYNGTSAQWTELARTITTTSSESLPGGGIDKTEVKCKTAQSEKPPTLELASRGYDEVTLKSIGKSNIDTAAEYRIAGGKWQDNPTFTGLKSGTEYTFEARYKGTENTTDSEGNVTMGYAPSNSVTAKFTTLTDTSNVVYIGGSTTTITASMEFNTTDGSVVYDSTSHTLTITPNEGYIVKEVALDGKTVTVTEGVMTIKDVYSLRKIAVTFDEKPKTDIVSDATALKLSARSKKLSSGNIKVTLELGTAAKTFISKMKSQGYTVKYKFYRSTKKASSYKAMIEKDTATYINTNGKSGTRYYYKCQIRVYDQTGTLVVKTELKNCKYACRKF